MAKRMMETLTESMFYVLMAFHKSECCGTDIAEFADRKTQGRVKIGPGTPVSYTHLDVYKRQIQCLSNIKAILESIDVPFDDIVKTTIFVKDLADMEAVNEVYTTFHPDSANAKMCIRDRGTTLGAILGTIMVMIKPESAVLTGIAVIIVITVCNLLHWNGSIVISGTVIAIIMFNLNNRDPFLYALSRLGDTFIGISVALLVNFCIKPQNYEKKVILTNLEIHKELDNFLAHDAYDVMKLEREIQSMKSHLATYDRELNWTHHYREEINLIRDHFRCYDQILLHLKALAELDEQAEHASYVRDYHEDVYKRQVFLHPMQSICSISRLSLR